MALDKPSDLLHVALICKSFYQMVIPTHHLDLVSISCSNSRAPLKFWQTLSVSSHYASMIRHLELCDQSTHTLQYFRAQRQQFLRQTINEEFARQFSLDSFLPVLEASNPQELFLQSLAYMDGLNSISILKQPTDSEETIEEYECLRHISKNFSNSLKTFHAYYSHLKPPNGFIPQYKSSVHRFGFFVPCSNTYINLFRTSRFIV